MATDDGHCKSAPFMKTSKPVLSVEDLKSLLHRQYGIQAMHVTEYESFDDRTYHVKVAPGPETGGRSEFIAKVMNALFTAVEGVVAVQCDITVHLKAYPNLSCQVIQPNLKGQLFSCEMIRNNFCDGDVFIESKEALSALRLFDFLPGETMEKASPFPPEFFFEVGQHLGKLQQALQDFPGDVEPLKLKSSESMWSLPSVVHLRHYLPWVKDVGRQQMVEAILDQFNKRILPVMQELRQGVIYQDYNMDNVLVSARPEDDLPVNSDPSLNDAPTSAIGQNHHSVVRTRYQISGLIDFDDIGYTCLVYEIAIGMMYIMFACDSPLEGAAYMLSGFESIAPLRSEERDLLKVLVACRFAQSLVISSFQMKNHPDNVYVQTSLHKGWSLLENWWSQTEAQLDEMWGAVKKPRSHDNCSGLNQSEL